LVKPISGFYLVYNNEGRWGGYSEDIITTWNSHLMLKAQKKHPLGNFIKFQYLGSQKVAYNPITFELPQADRNYGVKICEKCHAPYVATFFYQRFCKMSCRVNSFITSDKLHEKGKILQKYNYKCSSGPETCEDYWKSPKLIISWSDDCKPYCRSCFMKKIRAKELSSLNISHIKVNPSINKGE
jgi:ribosomal protein L40E